MEVANDRHGDAPQGLFPIQSHNQSTSSCKNLSHSNICQCLRQLGPNPAVSTPILPNNHVVRAVFCVPAPPHFHIPMAMIPLIIQAALISTRTSCYKVPSGMVASLLRHGVVMYRLLLVVKVVELAPVTTVRILSLYGIQQHNTKIQKAILIIRLRPRCSLTIHYPPRRIYHISVSLLTEKSASPITGSTAQQHISAIDHLSHGHLDILQIRTGF
jgi:hypothetical protein